MSAHREFYEAHQSLNILFQFGHTMSTDERSQILSQIINHTNRMISINSQNSIQRNVMTLTPRIINQPRYNPLEKSKVISKKKLEELCPTDCAVCQEKPKFKNAVYTECEHYFCKICWDGWMNSNNTNKTCPVCRKNTPKTTTFKSRASIKVNGPISQPLNRPVMVIEDDDEFSITDDF